jgi:hypothetical protein
MESALFILLLVSIPVFYVLGGISFLKFLFARKGESTTSPAVQPTPKRVVTQTLHPPKVTFPLTTYLDNPTKAAGFFFGFIYALVVSWQSIPSGAQVTILSLVGAGLVVGLSAHRRIKRSTIWWLLLSSYLILGGYALLTTNPFLDIINRLTVLSLTVGWLLYLSFGQLPQTTYEALHQLHVFAQGILAHAASGQFWRQIFHLPIRSFKVSGSLSSPRLLGMVISLPLLAVFHFLFTQINSEYAWFVSEIFRYLWRVLVFIWELDLVELLLKTAGGGVLFTLLLSPRLDLKKPVLSPTEYRLFVILEQVLAACAGIFGLFSYFQSKMVLADFQHFSFKELSTYVIHGFWEMLVAALIGYLVSLLVLHYLKQSAPDLSSMLPKRVKWWLTLFTSELLLVTGFTFHKLFTHQVWFGFKDQRLLATGAVIIVFLTFALLLLRIWRNLSDERVFAIQAAVFLSIIIFFNVLNIDLFITHNNPTSYFVEDQKYKDYSYLLGNSFDNYSTWHELATEALSINPPKPEGYYYGWYPGLCQTDIFGGPYESYRTTRAFNAVRPRSYLQNKLQYLENTYGNLSNKPLAEVTKFKWREYQAYLEVRRNPETLQKLINELCESPAR